MGRFDAVIFDVGGVLVESPVHAVLRLQRQVGLTDEVLVALFEHYSKVPGPGEPEPLWHRVEKGQLTVADFLVQARIDLATAGLDRVPIDPEQLNVYRDVSAHWQTVHAARRLRAAGYATAICTNNVREWASWRRSLPVDEFDVVVDSCEVGMRKPEPGIYALTCERLGVAPGRVLFCDDFSGNVEGARQAGLEAIHITRDLDAGLRELEAMLAR
jgi:epoxide hydrolase-like predicted phosphatase